MSQDRPPPEPARESDAIVAELRARLAEAEATLEAIRTGDIDALVVAGKDDRERVLALERADLPYRHFVEHMSEGAVTLAASGVVVYCNRFFAELVAAEKEAIVGLPLEAFIAEPSRAAFRAALAEAQPLRVASELVRGDRVLPVQLAFSTSGDDAEHRTNVVVTDLAERERIRELRAERELAESESLGKDRFLAAVGHDLRSPLSVISGWAVLLREQRDRLEPLHRKAVDAIERNARLQTKLLDDLLDVSRFHSGKLRVERAPLDLGALVADMVAALRVVADEKGVVLAADLPSEPVIVHGDGPRLEQVIHNLVGNALKFTPRGGKLALSLTRTAGEARVRVEDSGLGIEPELLPRVFEPFRQGAARQGAKPGLGLGLAIVKSLVQLHEGRVWAESEGLGKGATFTLALPILDGAEGAVAASATSASEPPPQRLRGLRLLVVDDEPGVHEVTAGLARREGAEVVAVDAVAAALARLERERFDLVLSDLMMPGTSGFEFARELARRGASDTLLVALTSHNSPEVEARAREAGFHAYLTKPLDLDALWALLRARRG